MYPKRDIKNVILFLEQKRKRGDKNDIIRKNYRI